MDTLLKISQLIAQIEPLLTAGLNVLPIFTLLKNVLNSANAEKRDPTDAEWNQLNGMIAGLRKQLHAP